MGDEDVSHCAKRQIRQHELSRDSVAAVYDVDRFADDDRLRGRSPVCAGARATRSAEQNEPRALLLLARAAWNGQ